MRDYVTQRPQVLVAARTHPRAAFLEALLNHEQRVEVLGAFTRASDLYPYLERDHALCLLLDSALEDASALGFLSHALLSRPVATIVLDGTPAAEFAFEGIRAGAVAALPWPVDPTMAFATRLSTLVEAAWRTPPHTLRRLPMRLAKSSPRPSETPTQSLVFVCGSCASATTFAAAHNLPSDSHAAIVTVDAVDRAFIKPFTRHLARFSSLTVSALPQGNLKRAHLYLFDDSIELASDSRGKFPSPRRITSRNGRHSNGTAAWLDAIAERLERKQLTHVAIVVNGYIDLSTTELIGHAVAEGAILAESTHGGFQARWQPSAPFQSLSTREFWTALHQHLTPTS